MIALLVGLVVTCIAGLFRIAPAFAALLGLVSMLPAALVVDRKRRPRATRRLPSFGFPSPRMVRRLEAVHDAMQRVENGTLEPDSREYLETLIALDSDTVRNDRNLQRSGWALIVVMILLDVWFAYIGDSTVLMFLVPTHVLIAFQTGMTHHSSKERLAVCRRRLANNEETLRIIEARGA